ncbi:MAG: 4Fe-4S binding protein [Candidatus Zipacnadales bacterium]
MSYPKDAPWHELARGGIIPQPATSLEYKTGGWRTFRPVRDSEACIDCLFCWVYCPDDAIICQEQSVKHQPIDLEHCKGCGVCAAVCPKNCIAMIRETEFNDA